MSYITPPWHLFYDGEFVPLDPLHPWDSDNQRYSSSQATTPEHCIDSRLKHTQSPYDRACLLVLGLWHQGQVSSLPHIQRLQSCCRKHIPGVTNFAFSLGLATVHWYLPERSFYTHVEAQFLQLLPRGYLQITWSGGQKDLSLWFHRTTYFCKLWRLLPESGFQSTWNYVLTEAPPFGTLRGLGTLSATGTDQE